MPTAPEIAVSTVVAQASGLHAVLVDGEVAMLHVDRGTYYTLNGTGSRVWDLVQHPTKVDAVCERLHLEFEINRGTCEREVIAILTLLVAEGLVEVVRCDG